MLAILTDADRQDAFASIGRFISAFASADLMVSAVLGALMRMGENGAQELILHAIPLSKKDQLIRSIVRQLPDVDYIKALPSLLDKLDRLRQQRDIAAHGIPTVENGQMSLHSMTLPKVLKTASGSSQYLMVVDIPSFISDSIILINIFGDLTEEIETKRTWNPFKLTLF